MLVFMTSSAYVNDEIMWKCVRKCYGQNCTIIWTLEACGNRNWINSMLMPWVCVCNGWTWLIRKQMDIRMSMICCGLYYCVKLDEKHVKDWMKVAYILRPRIGTLTKSHMMNLHKLVWNNMNVGLVYMSLHCYKLWWIVDNTIEDLKWCWKGWIGENLAKWTCVDVCVVRWKVINGVWFGEVLCQSRVRNIGRGKRSVSLTFGRREGVKPKTTSSPLLIFESAATGVALMISESATTQIHQQFLRQSYTICANDFRVSRETVLRWWFLSR
jgi:hypothetical protein